MEGSAVSVGSGDDWLSSRRTARHIAAPVRLMLHHAVLLLRSRCSAWKGCAVFIG